MTKPDDYLKRYRDRFRVKRGPDGVWNLQTRHRPREGAEFEVYDFSDTVLAACLPPRTARSLLKRFPDAFTLGQDADDAIVLLFPESRLDELARPLQLRTRHRLTEEERQEKAEALRRYQFRPATESDKLAPESTISHPSASVVASA
jgi:hypothetical protein